MGFDFSPLRNAELAVFGDPATFQPADSDLDDLEHSVIEVDPATLPPDTSGAPVKVLWTARTVFSGSRLPAKNDRYSKDGDQYRVYDVKTDKAGGVLIFLT